VHRSAGRRNPSSYGLWTTAWTTCDFAPQGASATMAKDLTQP